jgi:putative DNA primase/helicase
MPETILGGILAAGTVARANPEGSPQPKGGTPMNAPPKEKGASLLAPISVTSCAQNPTPSQNGVQFDPHDVQAVKAGLRERVDQLAQHLFPNGKCEGSHWVCGDITGSQARSFKICLVGEKAGLWGDFAGGNHHKSLLDLWMEKRSVDFPTALREAAQWVGYSPKPNDARQTAVVAASAPAKNAEAATADDQKIAALAALHPLEYERRRKEKAAELNCRETMLDKLVEEKRRTGKGVASLQGQAVVLPDVEPWPEPVDGAAVLDEMSETLQRYLVLPQGAADVLALWCAHTHSFESFECSPRLNISSPEKGCGKTTARDVVALFVPRPILTENMSVAILFRLVDAQKPVILADEYDTWLKFNDELRGLLNAGHRRGASVFRCEGDGNEVRQFNAYAPAVLCGIGTLRDTLHDRSIVIRLSRAKPSELSKRFDSRKLEPERELNRKLARFMVDSAGQLEKYDPKLPEAAFNRLADNWRPIFAVAEVVGRGWPQRCEASFTKLTGAANEGETESLRVMLIADMQKLFAGEYPELSEGKPLLPRNRIFSREIIEHLSTMAERPWPEVCHGKPITERWLARNLAVFGIHPGQLKIDGVNNRGYGLIDFRDAFARYLPNPPSPSATPLPYEGKTPFAKCYQEEQVAHGNTPFLEGSSTSSTCETTGEENACVPGTENAREPLDDLGKTIFPGGMVRRTANDGWPPSEKPKCGGCGRSLAGAPSYWQRWNNPRLVRCEECQECKWMMGGFDVDRGFPYGDWQATIAGRITEHRGNTRQKLERQEAFVLATSAIEPRTISLDNGATVKRYYWRDYKEPYLALLSSKREQRAEMPPVRVLEEARFLFNAGMVTENERIFRRFGNSELKEDFIVV